MMIFEEMTFCLKDVIEELGMKGQVEVSLAFESRKFFAEEKIQKMFPGSCR
jgi:hypothetical protein